MGVPSFFRWLVHKYPNVIVNAREAKAKANGEDEEIDSSEPNPNGMEFDNMYLDMNGIIHPCFHPEDHASPPTTYEEVFKTIFEYIDRLFRIVRPRKLLYMAIDGVAPRAKMNQQRARRFRTAKDAEIAEAEEERLRREFEMQGKKVLPKLKSEVSDSNVITPGTEFMDRLSKALQYYIRLRLNRDPGWKKIKVILSDANVPGEGEHKIMKFIRLQRNLNGYDPNTRHCLYGLDADLIMLALATHEVHFSILREDVHAEEQRPISIQALESSLAEFNFSAKVNTIIRGQSLVKKPYQFVNIWTLREYLELDLKIYDPPFVIDLERIVDDFILICFFTGNDFLPHMPTLEIREGAIDLLMSVYRDEFKKFGGYLVDMQKAKDKKAAYVNLKGIEKFILVVGTFEDRIFKKRMDLRQRMIKRLLRENAKVIDDQDFEQETPVFQSMIGNLEPKRTNWFCNPVDSTLTSKAKSGCYQTSSGITSDNEDDIVRENTKELEQKLKDFIREKSDLFKQGGLERDRVKLGMHGWKERYYEKNFSAKSPKDVEATCKEIVKKYVEGLCWVLQYYFLGVCSWSWYYPYHYSPFASDLKGLSTINISFEMGTPFKPFDQLMGVLPPRSVSALPKPYWNLMISEECNLAEFYPTDFDVDIEGKRYLWQGIVKLPFINEDLLLSETKKCENELKEDEAKRNSEAMNKLFVMRSHVLGSSISSFYKKHKSVKRRKNKRELIDPHLSGGMNGFICPCDDDLGLANSVFGLKGREEDVVKDDVICVRYECPDNHPHIPRPPVEVTFPEKTITEADIEKQPLWHEYEGHKPPNRLQIQHNCRTAINEGKFTLPDSSSDRGVWKGASSGFSAGRGKGYSETSNSHLYYESYSGIRAVDNRKLISTISTSASVKWVSGRGKGYTESSSYTNQNFARRGQGWSQGGPNQGNWSGNGTHGDLNSGRASGHARGTRAVNGGKADSISPSSRAGRGWTHEGFGQGNWNGNGNHGVLNSGQASGSAGGTWVVVGVKAVSPDPSWSGRGSPREGYNQGNWNENGTSRALNSGRASGSTRGTQMGNGGFLPSRNLSTDSRRYQG